MSTYRDAGVNIEEGYKAVGLMKEYASRTFTKGVINNLGSFAGMFEIPKYKSPVLVSGTDGVGTKLKVAFDMKKYDTVGIDCVAMCVNDILCHGAKPLYFLDYIACGKLSAKNAVDIVKGVSKGCLDAKCSLIGGETAEMPGFYKQGEYDIAGFCVGIVEKEKIIDGSNIKNGDILIGIESSGIHSNGYSLVRKLIKNFHEDFNGEKIGDILLTPTKIYADIVLKLIEKYNIKGMAHITGGGFYENIQRMFKKNITAVIDKESFITQEIFKYIMSLGVEENEMYNTFNMGIGYVLCVNSSDVKNIIHDIKKMGTKAYKIGYVESGGNGICLR